jgi:hypothetical protein
MEGTLTIAVVKRWDPFKQSVSSKIETPGGNGHRQTGGAGRRAVDAALAKQRVRCQGSLGQECLPADRKTTPSKMPTRTRWLLTIFVNIYWPVGLPESPENQYYPLLQGANDTNKGVVGTWEVDVIDAVRPMASEPIVINSGSDSFEGNRSRSHPARQRNRHLFVSGQCIEHVVA